MKLHALFLSGFLVISSIATAAETVVAANAAVPPSLVRIIVSLVLVVGSMILLAVLVKKFGLNRMQTSNFPVKIIGAMSLGNNQRIMIIEAGEEWVVLGVTPQNISTITSMPRQEDHTTIVSPDSSNFPAWMKKAFEKYSVKK